MAPLMHLILIGQATYLDDTNDLALSMDAGWYHDNAKVKHMNTDLMMQK